MKRLTSRCLALGAALVLCGPGLAQEAKSPDAPQGTDGAKVEAPAAPERKLAPQDRLTFEIKEDPASGPALERIMVPALGEVRFLVSREGNESIMVKVKDRTVEEIKAELTRRLEADYYVKATVFLQLENTLDLEKTKIGQIHFYGETKGVIPVRVGETKKLTEALIELGWTNFANLKKIQVHRLDLVTGDRSTIVVDAEAVLHPSRGKTPPPDFELVDQDRVEVPEKRIGFF